MKILRNFIYIYLFLFLFAAGISAAEATDAMPTGNDGKYKNYYSDGWFGTYALREFDKVAPTPGMNWFVADAQDWLARAQRDGWVVKNKPSEAVSGAIIVGYNEGLVWVGVAREVTDQGLVFETVMGSEGKPGRYWMKFAEIDKLIHFKGCILPQRTPHARTTSPMADYKSVRGFAGSAWPVQEFDKVAPKPGFNWQGPEKDWAKEAAAKGWRVMKNPTEIKADGLIVFRHSVSGQIKIAITRAVAAPFIIFDFVEPPYSRVITARLTMEQFLDKSAFDGFVFDSAILPERTKK